MEVWEQQQRALAAHFGGDSVIDPPRVLRLAGTVNYPSEKKAAKGYVPELVQLKTLYDDEQRDPVSPQALAAAYPLCNEKPTPGADIDFGSQGGNGLDVEHCLAEIVAGNDLHNNARDLAAHLVARGYDDFFVHDYLKRVLEPVSDGGTLGEIDTLIKSAREKFGTEIQRKFEPTSSAWPEPLADEAFYGLPGEIVRVILPHSEADPAALLVQTLVAAGNAIGRKPYFQAEADRHGANLFAVLVGLTAKGRKGASWGQVRRVMAQADEGWAGACVQSGLSSGEGLIWAVRDPIQKREPIKSDGRVVDYEMVETDPGVTDKRLLVHESEFASTLRVLGREGNTLSAIVRSAWDTGNLRTLTKASPAHSTGAHISIIGHITRDEALRYLDSTEAGNGFGNRILWVCTRRSKALPEGGSLSDADLALVVGQLKSTLAFASDVEQLTRNEDARQIWHAVYAELSEGKPGLLGAMVARAEAQVMRIACIYALLDQSSTVRASHLQAALAVWEYCEASAKFIFGNSLGDPVADEILRALRQAPDGLTRTDIRDLFGRHKRTGEISRALAVLIEHGAISYKAEATDGRPAERFFTSGVPA